MSGTIAQKKERCRSGIAAGAGPQDYLVRRFRREPEKGSCGAEASAADRDDRSQVLDRSMVNPTPSCRTPHRKQLLYGVDCGSGVPGDPEEAIASIAAARAGTILG